MNISAKTSKIFVITLLSAILLLSIIPIAIAQGQGSITLLDSLGGSTDPAAGPTVSHNAGTGVTLTATPLDGYEFVQWVIATAAGSEVVSDNPYTLTVAADTDYAIQPIFDVVQQIPGGVPVTNFDTAAIVVVQPSSGGTTIPAPGTYALADATQTTLTAMAADGWQFSHWSISGFPYDVIHGGDTFTGVRTENPYTVDHGYGNTYSYQAVFTQIGQTTPTPVGQSPTPGPGIGGLSTEMIIIIALVVVIVILLIAFGVFAMRKHH
jgi:hypothetical protein